jgi:hypothetical protein
MVAVAYQSFRSSDSQILPASLPSEDLPYWFGTRTECSSRRSSPRDQAWNRQSLRILLAINHAWLQLQLIKQRIQFFIR